MLIAHAREDIPFRLSEYDRLTAKVEQLEAEISGYREAEQPVRYGECRYESRCQRQVIESWGMQDHIIQSYNHCQDKGCCPIYALENVHDMFREYKALDGNGTIAKLVEEMEDMPRENTNDKKEKRLS